MSKSCGKRPGIIYLVGAGPGHPGLITRLGYDLLQECDAVAYDALIPMELIAGLPDRVEKHYVGKRSGRHSLQQSRINELLVELARRGLRVVRLKGGDPFIFGRVGEEAEHLAAAGIPMVMVPGVTAASAAAAMSGFSLTNRHASSWVFMATGHCAESSSIPVPWERVAALPGGTLVVYMGLAKLDQVVAELISSGLSPETSAIVVQAASTGLQRSVEAPLARLSLECKNQRLKPPALVVIGESVRFRSIGTKIAAESLTGKKILVTSPSQTTAQVCLALRKRGAEPIPYPTVNRKQVDDVEGWARLVELIDSGGTCLLAGETEADCFFRGLLARGRDARSLARCRILALGSSTEHVLLGQGIRADSVIEPREPQATARCISEQMLDGSKPLIWVCGNLGGSLFEAARQELGAGVIPLTVWLDSTAAWDAHWKDELIENPPDYVIFTSPTEVEGFVDLLGTDLAYRLGSRSRIASMNALVTEMLVRYALPIEVESEQSDVECLAGALERNAGAHLARCETVSGHS